MSLRLAMTCVSAVLVVATPVSGQGDMDAWHAFKPLIGQWRGEGLGFGSVSDVVHEWAFTLQERFLWLRTKSVTRGKGGAGEVHEDIGFLSHDKDRSAFVFRQFLSEGYVNTFDVSVGKGDRLAIVFVPRESESAGGMRPQMQLKFLSDTEYEMVLDLATPGKDFSPCQRMRMKKAD